MFRLRQTRIESKVQAKLVVKGFNQHKGINFDKIFLLVMKIKITYIRVMLALVANLDLELNLNSLCEDHFPLW